MGVAGCGKSTLAGALARALSATLIEGDDHHPPQSHEKMRRGVPLQDADREPGWAAWRPAGGRAGPAVLTCSALSLPLLRAPAHRRAGAAHRVHRDPDEQSRAGWRPAGHLFPPALVASQFDALEPPLGEPGVLVVPALGRCSSSLCQVLR